MMNFPGVAANDPKMLGEIAATAAAGKTVGGHYASPDLGLPFHGYAAGGPADDHEGTRAEDAIARVRQGMRAMLRLGSAWYDVADADHGGDREGARPAQLHPVHRRLPLRHAGERRAYGPGGAARHRLRAEADDGDADGDDQHGASISGSSASSARSRRGGGRTS